MADNYLERRQEELKNAGKVVLRRSTPSLDTLLLRNRSHRGFDASYIVHRRQLECIASVNTRLASGRNAQTLRFRIVDETEGSGLGSLLHLGGFLPELHLPLPGTEPKAFIVVCGTVPENSTVDIDLGISLQSMSLKAVELGLNALIVRAFDREPLRAALGLELEPLAVLAIGKGIEDIRLVEVDGGSDLKYFRKDGVHYVPKIKLADLLL